MEIEVNKIKPDKNQPRKTFDEKKLKEMSETFKTQGTIQPIEVDEKNIIITGELRWRACKLAGLKTIPVKVIKELSSEQRLERQLVENFNRQDMRLVDSIPAIQKFMDYLSKSPDGKRFTSEGHGNMLIGETATRLGISRRWLSENIKLEKEAPKELKKAIKEEKVSVSTATEIMKLPKEEREEFTKEVLEQSKIPEHRKIREQVQGKKEKKKMEEKLEEMRKELSRKEIKIQTDREKLLRLQNEIIQMRKDRNRFYADVRWMKKTKFYLNTPKQKDSFIRFLEGESQEARNWADKLDNLKEEIDIEITKE